MSKVLLLLVLCLTAGCDAIKRPGAQSLVGAWECTREADGFRWDDEFIFLGSGRYAKRNASTSTKPGENYSSRHEEFGAWDLVDERLLLTVEGGSSSGGDAKPYVGGSSALIRRPDADTIGGLILCDLKREKTTVPAPIPAKS